MTLRRSGVYFRKTRSNLRGLVFLHQLESGDVALFLEDAGDLGLQFRDRDVHALVLAAAALRMRVRKSAMGSVCMFLLNSLTSWPSRRRGFLP